MIDTGPTPPTAEPPKAWVPSLNDQLRVMKDHWQKTGRAAMPKPMGRAENLLRRSLTPAQIDALPFTFGPDPTPEERASGMISVANIEYEGHHWSIMPLIQDMRWDPEQLLAALTHTPPDKPVKIEGNPVLVFNIIYQHPDGVQLVLVHKVILADQLYNKILETPLPHHKEET